MAGTQYNATRHDAAEAGAAGSAMMRFVTLTCMAMAAQSGAEVMAPPGPWLGRVLVRLGGAALPRHNYSS
jgi:hypothetical protein